MIVKVTEEHILTARKFDCRNCPVAKALRQFNPDLSSHREAHIWYGYAKRSINDRMKKITTLDDTVSEFIRAFDNDQEKPKPIEFHISAECFMI